VNHVVSAGREGGAIRTLDISRVNQERHKWQRIDTWAAQRFNALQLGRLLGKLHHYPILPCRESGKRVRKVFQESLSGSAGYVLD